MAEFKADKLGLLRSNPIGGMQLSATIKALVLADPELIDDMLWLSKQGNNMQATAIGVGIGLAVKVLRATDRALADRIAAEVAAKGDRYLIAGYNIALNEALAFAFPDSGDDGVGGGGSNSPSTYSNEGGGAYTSSYPLFGGSSISCTSSVSPYRAC